MTLKTPQIDLYLIFFCISLIFSFSWDFFPFTKQYIIFTDNGYLSLDIIFLNMIYPLSRSSGSDISQSV